MMGDKGKPPKTPKMTPFWDPPHQKTSFFGLRGVFSPSVLPPLGYSPEVYKRQFDSPHIILSSAPGGVKKPPPPPGGSKKPKKRVFWGFGKLILPRPISDFKKKTQKTGFFQKRATLRPCRTDVKNDQNLPHLGPEVLFEGEICPKSIST